VPRVQVNASIPPIKLIRRGSIEGVVSVAETGEPVTGFTVLLTKPKQTAAEVLEEEPDTESKGRKPETMRFQDNGGYYRIPNVDPGRYDIRVVADGLSPRQNRIHVREGDPTIANVQLTEGLTVTGVVMDVKANAPVAGAKVIVLPGQPKAAGQKNKDKKKSSGVQRVGKKPPAIPDVNSEDTGDNLRPVTAPQITGDDGTFAFRDLEDGKYLLVVYHPDFLLADQNFQVIGGGAPSLPAIRLRRGEQLVGSVVNGQEKALAGAILKLKEIGGLMRTATCDASGKFLLSGLQPGSFSIIIQFEEASMATTVQIKKQGGQPNRIPAIKFSPGE
jgi:hypothetical protein